MWKHRIRDSNTERVPLITAVDVAYVLIYEKNVVELRRGLAALLWSSYRFRLLGITLVNEFLSIAIGGYSSFYE